MYFSGQPKKLFTNSSNQQNTYVIHLPKAAAMLLLGTPPRCTDPKFTLVEGAFSMEEDLASVSIVMASREDISLQRDESLNADSVGNVHVSQQSDISRLS